MIWQKLLSSSGIDSTLLQHLAAIDNIHISIQDQTITIICTLCILLSVNTHDSIKIVQLPRYTNESEKKKKVEMFFCNMNASNDSDKRPSYDDDRSVHATRMFYLLGKRKRTSYQCIIHRIIQNISREGEREREDDHCNRHLLLLFVICQRRRITAYSFLSCLKINFVYKTLSKKVNDWQ